MAGDRVMAAYLDLWAPGTEFDLYQGGLGREPDNSHLRRPRRTEWKKRMKATLRMSRGARIVGDRDRSIGFMGEEGRVYGTSDLVRDIEHRCRDLLEHVDPGEDLVGTEIAVRRTAPTLLGTGTVAQPTAARLPSP
jgi:hypothetical protein